jgi:hypothetical protein
MTKSTYKLLIYFLMLLLLSNCLKEKESSSVEGYIRNYYNNEPIDSVKVTLTDGIYAGTPPPDFKYPKKSVVYTDANGYFKVKLENPDWPPFFYASKIGYSFDPQWDDGVSVGVSAIGYGHHTNQVFQLKPDTSFCATINNIGEIADSLKISFLNFHSPSWEYENSTPDDKVYVYGTNVKNNKMYFSGNGPWHTCDCGFIYYNTIADYLRYTIEIKRSGVWSAVTDSINLENLGTPWDSFDKAVIEIK